MVQATYLGAPRVGPRRELKKALERHWRGELNGAGLHQVGRQIREQTWLWARQAGLQQVPCNDFSYYDHVLDTAMMVGAVPEAYVPLMHDPLAAYFAMARGGETPRGPAPALEMTKWFDTNYHYIVPRVSHNQTFSVGQTQVVEAFQEAKNLGLDARPVLLGPLSFLLLAKVSPTAMGAAFNNLVSVYAEILARLAQAGARWVQMDEPCLTLDLDTPTLALFEDTYKQLSSATPLRLLLAAYHGPLKDNLATAFGCGVAAVHLDMVRGGDDLQQAFTHISATQLLSLGLVDGRNIWRCNLDAAMQPLKRAASALGHERVMVNTSCSLLHVPYDLTQESATQAPYSAELLGWLAFAKQKLAELRSLADALEGKDVAAAFTASRASVQGRAQSQHVHRHHVQNAVAHSKALPHNRKSPFKVRYGLQADRLQLPPFPTTTIGSFPQTTDLRAARAEHRRGTLSDADYQSRVNQATRDAIAWQDKAGLDVLVHGEFERNDMVEYFGERLDGFAFTQHGWVQSYGSRCVKPPIIYGDVSRPQAMTVAMSKFAQSLTKKPVKGMLTGPVTMMCWSFVRDDQPRQDTCSQIALALRDEVLDLEQAGLQVIQVDEPALREGLPLRKSQWPAYLTWATECFRVSTAGVADATQIHTHMCYAEFNDIIDGIIALDADVISIESSRSSMTLLDGFAGNCTYPNAIGPGVWDIHSPNVPTAAAMTDLLRGALKVFGADALWVNPDCGLKTRGWQEVELAVANMVQAARNLRDENSPQPYDPSVRNTHAPVQPGAR